ncbi:succinylglutamate desuccinylase/aspartoacylase family protein [Ferdinandcohnia sp. SAFN-114]|uniref:succinylglutamate desuccinylase/aspartoacylase family protein n=1 Tax=Ferdinandcohnia sp. SAFN-114 TaxID=3387275 RepID=UPI003F7DB90D
MRVIESLDELELDLHKGEVLETRITIGSLPDAANIDMPVIIGNGREAGPTLLLTGLLHGIEIGGYDVIRRLLYEEIKFNELRGRIIAVPIVNPLALRAASRFTPQDSNDLNRVFPGNANGTLSQRIANIISEGIVPYADYVVDFHSCNPPSEVFTIVDAGGDHQVKEASMNLAKAFGAITVTPAFEIPGTFSGHLSSIGKPAITPELVFSRRFDQSAEIGVIGTKNVMKHLGMMEGVIEELPNTLPYSEPLLYTAYYANKGGFVYFKKSIGQTVQKGEVFAKVCNPFGEIVDEMYSPVDGTIIAYPLAGNQSVTTGDKVAYFASKM